MLVSRLVYSLTVDPWLKRAVSADMNLWLKATKLYSTALINVIPTGGYALQVVRVS